MHWGMMMTSDKTDISAQGADQPPENALLAQLFADAQASPPELGAGLRARILADADACLTPAPRRKQGFAPWRSWFSGWAAPGLAGGAAVAVAGFWIGVSLPMPGLALDAPEWMQGALGTMDLIAIQLIGLDDPLLLEF